MSSILFHLLTVVLKKILVCSIVGKSIRFLVDEETVGEETVALF